MDLEEYWQENKRFLAQVGIGFVVFLIGLGVIGATVGARFEEKQRDVSGLQRQLRDAYFGRTERNAATDDNEALVAAAVALREQVRFVPREQFRGTGESQQRVDTNRYLTVASRVRTQLMPLASRFNVEVDETLGLPEQSPTRSDELERHLDALDVIERVVGIAIEERVAAVESIKVRLDPGLRGRKGIGSIERSRVIFQIRGDDLALERTIARLQLDEPQPLVVEEAVMRRSREDPELVVLELSVLIARVPAPITEEETEA